MCNRTHDDGSLSNHDLQLMHMSTRSTFHDHMRIGCLMYMLKIVLPSQTNHKLTLQHVNTSNIYEMLGDDKTFLFKAYLSGQATP